MRCVKTRTLLGLLTAAWLVGVMYFLTDLLKSDQSTHDVDSYLENYDNFLAENNDYHERGTASISDQSVSNYLFLIEL